MSLLKVVTCAILTLCFPSDNIPLRINVRRMMAMHEIKSGMIATASMHVAISNYYVSINRKLLPPVQNDTLQYSNVEISTEEINGTLKKYLDDYIKGQMEDESDI